MYLDIFLNKIKRFIPKKLFRALQPVYHYILSLLAAIVYRFPSEELIVIGVTGTTGKTTSVYLIAKMLMVVGFKVGFTSTAMFNDGTDEWLNDKKMTMVGRFFMQRILRRMARSNCQFAVIETSSEGIVQFRHKFINYDTLVFTGLYPEHIESHGSFDNYKKAKAKLFAHLKFCRTKYINENNIVVKFPSGIKKLELQRIKKVIIANGEDEYSDYFLKFWADRKITYVNKFKSQLENNIEQVVFNNTKNEKDKSVFRFDHTLVNLNFLGDFNTYNAMSAVCVGLNYDLKPVDIKAGLEKIQGIPGRLERIDEGQKFTVIIDYAFEPKAVSKLYESIKFFTPSKIIHVLGSCGGGRDISRRPILGKLAGLNANYVIVTNEDPYDDDPEIIIEQVVLGAEKAGKKLNDNLFKISDRREAIKRALSMASENDLVLITGKGSEQAIIMGNGNRIPWDDRSITRALLNELKP